MQSVKKTKVLTDKGIQNNYFVVYGLYFDAHKSNVECLEAVAILAEKFWVTVIHTG